jgi:VCBS repeat-containing protein
VSITPQGIVTYQPPLDFNGFDTFTYTVEDNGLTGGQLDKRSNVGTHTVEVTPVNDSPIAVNDAFASTEDAVLQVEGRGILANDIDIDLPADTLTVFNATSPGSPLTLTSDQGATVTVNADGQFTYDPTSAANIQALRAGQSLLDLFRYRATDGQIGAGGQAVVSNLATVTISVQGANDAPVANNDTFTVSEDGQLVVGANLSILTNDTDAELLGGTSSPVSSLTAVLISRPASGSFSLNADGSFNYTPNPGFSGSDSFVYRANDGSLSSAPATVAITVTPVNDPPIAVNDSYNADQNTLLTVSAANGVLGNDSDEDQTASLSASVVTTTSNGTLALSSNGSFTYQPRVDFSGTDSFTYRATDNGGLQSASATVTITVARTAVFQNPTNSRDVNNDGVTSPIDVLLLINYLNANGSHVLTTALPGISFPDTNGDNNISPADVLVVVNQLNSPGSGEGEGLAQGTSIDLVEQPIVWGLASQPAAGGAAEVVLELAADEQLSGDDDDTLAEDFFSELGRYDFARQHQAMSSSARASLAAKAKDLESALDSLFGVNDLQEERLN